MKRTSFAARVEVIKHESDGSVQDCKITDLLPFDEKKEHAKDAPGNSCDSSWTNKTFTSDPIRVKIHAFEEVRVIAAATDYNKWFGSGPATNTKGPFFVVDSSQSLSALSDIDLSFDKLPRNLCGHHVRLELKIEAKFEGNSIWFLLNRAKQEAARLKYRKTEKDK